MSVFAATLVLVILAEYSYEVAAQACIDLDHTNCTTCIKKGDDCYWCPATAQCLKWDWARYPDCKGSEYFYGQCGLSGVGIIVLFSIGVFLLIVAIVACCVCCCCCSSCCCIIWRRRRRGSYEPIRRVREDPQDQQRLFQARREEIRHKYGLDTNDSTV